jgi:hypothetical protein
VVLDFSLAEAVSVGAVQTNKGTRHFFQDATEENLTVALTPARRRRRSLTYAVPGQIRSVQSTYEFLD